jgi:small conductance mechanosensitive channel
MTNYSTEEQRRVDWTFGIGYGDKVAEAEALLKELISADGRILSEPEAFIGVSELADSSVNLVVRVWVKGEDYWGVYFDMNRKVYEEFSEKGINIPYPQLDVHLHQ